VINGLISFGLRKRGQYHHRHGEKEDHCEEDQQNFRDFRVSLVGKCKCNVYAACGKDKFAVAHIARNEQVSQSDYQNEDADDQQYFFHLLLL
jgi:hypothetical protein